MGKSADAFRTISEVAEWLGIPTHVLRFWESKFSQVKPVKRAGGRRYYRPGDMLLLGGIKKLLHDDGMTIKGVQKILRKDGIGPVAEQSQPLDDLTAAEFNEIEDKAPTAASKPSPGQVAEFKRESPELPEDALADGTPAVAPAAKTTKPGDAAPPAEPSQPPGPAEAAPVAAPEPQPVENKTAVPAPSEPSPPEPEPEPVPAPEPAPAPAQISVPDDPGDGIAAAPGILSQLARLPRPLPPELAAKLAPILARLHKISGTSSPASEN